MLRLDVRALRTLIAVAALGGTFCLHGVTDRASAQGAAEPSAPPAAAPAPVAEPDKAQVATPPAAAPVADPLLDEIRRVLAEPARGAGDRGDYAALAAFYAARKEQPVWMSAGGFNARAQHALAEIAKADDWGLSAEKFELPRLAPGTSEPAALANAEVKLGLAVLKYARFARGARVDPLQLSPNLDQKVALREPSAVLDAVAATETPGDYLTALHPRHEQFQKLRQALLKARAGETAPEPAAPAFVALPDGPQLKSGMKHAHVALLRQRLGLDARPDDPIFDAELAEAVKSFQREKGLQASGQLTPRTRQLLNAAAPKPAAKPVSLIPRLVANMERWRWMPEDMGQFHVWQNTPEYAVRVVKDGAVVHQAKVIVGKVGNQTPIFSASMRYIVFHPEWGVPDSIKVKEILPYLRPAQDDIFSFFGGSFGGADTRVLQKHNLRVSYGGKQVDASTVNWNQVDIRRYTFIQPAGATNVLGVVKFRFPNKHDVYMHDTPQRELFGKEVRTFSHGCVRVQNPTRLAEVLLAEDKGWTPDRVQSVLSAGATNEVELTKQIPVHLSYFTAVVGDDGKLNLYDDIYSHDARLTAALAGKYVAPEVVADANPDGPPAKARKGKRKPPVTDNLW